MSKPFAHQVLDAIEGMKTVTAEQVMPMFPHKKRREVVKALQNAAHRGLLVPMSAEKERTEEGTFAKGVWRVVQPDRPLPIPCVSCVWDLGSGPVQVPWMPGKRYEPLGSWQ